MRLLSPTPPQLAMLTPNDAAAAATTEMLHGESPIDMRARHSMELIRQKCAARLQQQLHNSALRLEKASEVDALGDMVGKITTDEFANHEGDAAAGTAPRNSQSVTAESNAARHQIRAVAPPKSHSGQLTSRAKSVPHVRPLAASPSRSGGVIEPGGSPSARATSRPRSCVCTKDRPISATASRAMLPSSQSVVPRTTAGVNSATGRTSPSRNSRIIARNLGAARTSPGRPRTVSASTPRHLHRSVGTRQTAANVAAALTNSPRRRRKPFANRDGSMTSATGTMLWAGPSELADNLSTQFFDAAKIAAQSQANDVEDGVKHFSIADPASPQLTSRAQHFQEVAQTLETAVSAVSAVKNGKKPGLGDSAVAQSASTPPRQIATPFGSLRNMKDSTPRSSFRQAPHTKRSSFDRNAAPTGFVSSRSEFVKNAVANLALENRALKVALSNAVKQLSELEGEQECFMSEGVFDLVNSLCRESSACNMAVAPTPGAAEVAAGP